MLFETNIAVPETAGEPAVWCDGHHPATHASATNSATVMMNNTDPSSATWRALEPLSPRAFELRLDIAKEAALRRLGSPLTDS